MVKKLPTAAIGPLYLFEDTIWEALEIESKAYVVLQIALSEILDDWSSTWRLDISNYLLGHLLQIDSVGWSVNRYNQVLGEGSRNWLNQLVEIRGVVFEGPSLRYYPGTSDLASGLLERRGEHQSLAEGDREYQLPRGNTVNFYPDGLFKSSSPGGVRFHAQHRSGLQLIRSLNADGIEQMLDGTLNIMFPVSDARFQASRYRLEFTVPGVCQGYIATYPYPEEQSEMLRIARDDSISGAELAKGMVIVNFGSSADCASQQARQARFFGDSVELSIDGSISAGTLHDWAQLVSASTGTLAHYQPYWRLTFDSSGRVLSVVH